MQLFVGLSGHDKAIVHDNLLSAELQNIWAKSIQDAFTTFGITGDYLSNIASANHIDKLVDDRNAIAHGRERPETVGSNYTTGDIDDLIIRIESETQFFISKLKQFYNDREFIRRKHRTRYKKKESSASNAP